MDYYAGLCVCVCVWMGGIRQECVQELVGGVYGGSAVNSWSLLFLNDEDDLARSSSVTLGAFSSTSHLEQRYLSPFLMPKSSQLGFAQILPWPRSCTFQLRTQCN